MGSSASKIKATPVSLEIDAMLRKRQREQESIQTCVCVGSRRQPMLRLEEEEEEDHPPPIRIVHLRNYTRKSIQLTGDDPILFCVPLTWYCEEAINLTHDCQATNASLPTAGTAEEFPRRRDSIRSYHSNSQNNRIQQALQEFQQLCTWISNSNRPILLFLTKYESFSYSITNKMEDLVYYFPQYMGPGNHPTAAVHYLARQFQKKFDACLANGVTPKTDRGAAGSLGPRLFIHHAAMNPPQNRSQFIIDSLLEMEWWSTLSMYLLEDGSKSCRSPGLSNRTLQTMHGMDESTTSEHDTDYIVTLNEGKRNLLWDPSES